MDTWHFKRRQINSLIEFFCCHILSSLLAANPEAIRTRRGICDSLFFEPLLESIINASTDTFFRDNRLTLMTKK